MIVSELTRFICSPYSILLVSCYIDNLDDDKTDKKPKIYNTDLVMLTNILKIKVHY